MEWRVSGKAINNRLPLPKKEGTKMKLKKTMAMLLAGAMCVGLMAGCGSSSSSSSDSGSAASTSANNGDITLIMSARDEFLSTLESAAISVSENYGYDLTTQDAQSDSAKQIQYIETAVNGGNAAVIVVPVDADSAESLVDAANGTPLVFVNRQPTDMTLLDEENVAFCGSEEESAGYYQGEWLAEYFQAKGQTEISYIMLQGTLGQVSTTKRSAGVLQALEDNGITATEATSPLACDYDRPTAQDMIAPLLTGGTQFDCIISNNDAMALGAIEACEAAGVDVDFPIVGIDCTADGAQSVSEGKLSMTVYQNPLGQGQGAIEAAINLINGNPANEGTEFTVDDSGESYSDSIVWIDFEKVTTDNVEDYM